LIGISETENAARGLMKPQAVELLK
jgi:hypothetical protein